MGVQLSNLYKNDVEQTSRLLRNFYNKSMIPQCLDFSLDLYTDEQLILKGDDESMSTRINDNYQYIFLIITFSKHSFVHMLPQT